MIWLDLHDLARPASNPIARPLVAGIPAPSGPVFNQSYNNYYI